MARLVLGGNGAGARGENKRGRGTPEGRWSARREERGG